MSVISATITSGPGLAFGHPGNPYWIVNVALNVVFGAHAPIWIR
jgi:hypothetical protein